ncbi:Uncharacterised protein [Salmonella enterica subsp. salamae]|nr:Uncharacterised protein [Salmonella enterica subsp. salamae]
MTLPKRIILVISDSFKVKALLQLILQLIVQNHYGKHFLIGLTLLHPQASKWKKPFLSYMYRVQLKGV